MIIVFISNMNRFYQRFQLIFIFNGVQVVEVGHVIFVSATDTRKYWASVTAATFAFCIA